MATRARAVTSWSAPSPSSSFNRSEKVAVNWRNRSVPRRPASLLSISASVHTRITGPCRW